ncbi:MAG: tRNA lysidine(34) synthetase TilS [Candidatus Omnitrophota bacterium]|nr:tRNA lysidine(34) synthetase TilS [Candidatus Omnitrophota bacterium]
MKKFKETIKKYGLIKEGEKILIGVSGGPDSLTLLLQLAGLKPKMRIALHVAHMDHGLRMNSAADALFVERLSKKLNIPVTVNRLSPKLIQKKGSLEEICREARLDFFIKTAKKIKADKVALGHNLDDQAETVLMRLLRGTGLSGLSGISVNRKIRGITFIRPLLEIPRDQINKYLKIKKLKACLDQTNKEDLFFRNKIRHKLIPLLKNKFNPNIVEILSHLAESSSYDYEYLIQAAQRSLGGNNSRLNLKKIMKLHPAILRLKIRQSIASIQGDTRRIGFKHIKEIEDLLSNRPTGSIVDLPKGISVQKIRNCLRFYKR